MNKPGTAILLLVLAIVVPFVLYKAPEWLNKKGIPLARVWHRVEEPKAAASTTKEQKPKNDSLVVLDQLPGADLPVRPADSEPRHYALEEVFRFDITPDWVISRWPRVTARLSELELQGYRVPLVTGTDESDIAGALTYYFDGYQRLQKITFVGTTGNARRLVEFVVRHFGLARRLTNDPQIFVYENRDQRGNPWSQLWIRPAPVLQADDPLHRFEVSLVLRRPQSRLPGNRAAMPQAGPLWWANVRRLPGQ